MAAPLVLEGRPVGKLRASWLLTKEAFRFLRADTELILVPVVATLLLVALLALLILLVLVTGMVTANQTESIYTMQSLIFVMGSYFLCAYVVALARAAVTYTVSVRAVDGNATLGESLSAAFKRTPALALWALVSSTVGAVLRLVSERSDLVASLLARLVGTAWNIATLFVVPAIVIENCSSFKAMTRSAAVFRQMWGETLITSISIGLVFMLVHVVLMTLFIGSLFLSISLHLPALFLAGMLLWIICASTAFILHSVLSSIITTLLYIYATAAVPPHNFSNELLAQIVVRNKSVVASRKIDTL